MLNVPKLPHETLGFKMAANGKKKRREKEQVGSD